jgi:hypothetical protein
MIGRKRVAKVDPDPSRGEFFPACSPPAALARLHGIKRPNAPSGSHIDERIAIKHQYLIFKNHDK